MGKIRRKSLPVRKPPEMNQKKGSRGSVSTKVAKRRKEESDKLWLPQSESNGSDTESDSDSNSSSTVTSEIGGEPRKRFLGLKRSNNDKGEKQRSKKLKKKPLRVSIRKPQVGQLNKTAKSFSQDRRPCLGLHQSASNDSDTESDSDSNSSSTVTSEIGGEPRKRFLGLKRSNNDKGEKQRSKKLKKKPLRVSIRKPQVGQLNKTAKSLSQDRRPCLGLPQSASNDSDTESDSDSDSSSTVTSEIGLEPRKRFLGLKRSNNDKGEKQRSKKLKKQPLRVSIRKPQVGQLNKTAKSFSQNRRPCLGLPQSASNDSDTESDSDSDSSSTVTSDIGLEPRKRFLGLKRSNNDKGEKQRSKKLKKQPLRVSIRKPQVGQLNKAAKSFSQDRRPCLELHQSASNDSDTESDSDSDSSSTVSSIGTGGKPRKRFLGLKRSNNNKGEEQRTKKLKKEPLRVSIRKPQVGQLKKTAKSFSQHPPCFELPQSTSCGSIDSGSSRTTVSRSRTGKEPRKHCLKPKSSKIDNGKKQRSKKPTTKGPSPSSFRKSPVSQRKKTRKSFSQDPHCIKPPQSRDFGATITLYRGVTRKQQENVDEYHPHTELPNLPKRASTVSRSGTGKKPKEHCLEPKSSNNQKGKEQRSNKSKKKPPPNRSFRKPPVGQRKKTPKSFLQDLNRFEPPQSQSSNISDEESSSDSGATMTLSKAGTRKKQENVAEDHPHPELPNLPQSATCSNINSGSSRTVSSGTREKPKKHCLEPKSLNDDKGKEQRHNKLKKYTPPKRTFRKPPVGERKTIRKSFFRDLHYFEPSQIQSIWDEELSSDAGATRGETRKKQENVAEDHSHPELPNLSQGASCSNINSSSSKTAVSRSGTGEERRKHCLKPSSLNNNNGKEQYSNKPKEAVSPFSFPKPPAVGQQKKTRKSFSQDIHLFQPSQSQGCSVFDEESSSDSNASMALLRSRTRKKQENVAEDHPHPELPNIVRNDRNAELQANKHEKEPSRAPLGQLNNRGASFLQNGPCFEVAPAIGQCRECRSMPNQESRNKSNICCRFFAFRKLRYSKNRKLTSAGFSAGKTDVLDASNKLWLPNLSNPPPDLDLETSKFLLMQVGDHFCDLLKQEQEAHQVNISDNKTIAWRSVVNGVRELCDVCETTLFNYHWSCKVCGFVVCLDCYKSCRTAKPPSDSVKVCDESMWLRCINRSLHRPDKLMLTQIIANDCLQKLGKMVHEMRDLWSIEQSCDCPEVSIVNKAECREAVNSIMAKNNEAKDEEPFTKKESSSNWPIETRISEHENENNNHDPLFGLKLCPFKQNEKSELKHFIRSYNAWQNKKRQPKAPKNKITLTISRLLYPNVPHSWLCYGKVLMLADPECKDNSKIFQDQWQRGQPVIVSDVSRLLDKNLWSPKAFTRDFGDEKSNLIDCVSGNIVPNQPMRKFWEGFEDPSKRLKDDQGLPMLLKLKDWPPGDDFAQMLPSRFQDLMQALPMQEYTKRCGKLNLAARLPDCFVRPDLGPKMYTAYGKPLPANKGTTNLHLDVSDAVNVMVYVGVPQDSDKHLEEALEAIDEAGCDILTRRRVSDKGELPGALWHIYNVCDADKIRDLLNKVTMEQGGQFEPHSDPIHDQSCYLDDSLRKRLYREYQVEGYAILQCQGDAVFIPAGAPHQVRNLNNCIKVAEDFVSPENVAQCFHLMQEFRALSNNHSNHEDKLQIKNIIYHTVKDAVCTLGSLVNKKLGRRVVAHDLDYLADENSVPLIDE